MRKSYIYIIGATMLLAPASALAQASLSPRTAIAVASPTLLKAPAAQAAAVGAASSQLSAYVTIDPARTSWQQLGVTPIAENANTATVRLTLDALQRLAKQQGVEYIQITSGATQMLNLARQEAGTDQIHKGTDLPQAYTGEGVVVGVVDAGFDYMHAAFRRPADGALRIKRVWEQGATTLDGASAPAKYGYGIELNTSELIEKAQGDSDSNSHGTHVAAIAAGSDAYKDGAYVGNAPDADIVLVALDLNASTNADISNAVQYIFDYADEVGKPCVVNLSLGNQDGPHDGTSTFDTMTDAMQGPGRLIVGAAGNHRTDAFHIDHTFATADAAPLRTFVKYKVAPSNSVSGGTIEIWGEKGVDFTVDIAAYSTFNKKDARSTTVYPAEGVTNVDFGKYATGTWKVASEVSPLNGKPHVVLTSALTSIRNNYAIALTVTPKTAGRVNIWSDNTYLALESRDIEGFSAPDAASSTLCEIGGTGKRILTVGSYTTRNEYTTNGGQQATLQETVGDLSSFSSYGPTVDGRMKPNITAPGCFIISAVSNNDASGNLMYAEYNENFGRYNQYGYMQGTSMASPFVAGIVATWLQAYPQLTPEQLHEIVQNTARKDNFTATAPDSNWGYGKINALDGLRQCIEKQETGCVSVAMPFDGTVRIVDGNILLGFARDTQATLGITSMTGSTLFSKQLGKRSAGETLSVAVPQLPKGVYLLSVKTPTATKTFKFVWQ
ncbi:peptidase S8/S53 family [Prevotella sp. CAG:520]|nr:peptidase S8/S53 family [Prevotella sp. CAG:520]